MSVQPTNHIFGDFSNNWSDNSFKNYDTRYKRNKMLGSKDNSCVENGKRKYHYDNNDGNDDDDDDDDNFITSNAIPKHINNTSTHITHNAMNRQNNMRPPIDGQRCMCVYHSPIDRWLPINPVKYPMVNVHTDNDEYDRSDKRYKVRNPVADAALERSMNAMKKLTFNPTIENSDTS